MKNCAKCGKALTISGGEHDGWSIVGMQILVSWKADTPPTMTEHIKRNLGKYAPQDESVTEVEFQFCYECWIDAMMGVIKIA